MVSPFDFIIRPKDDTKYNREKKIGDKTLITSTSIENAKDVNRFGIVVEVPLSYNGDIKIGDEVVIHHNIFRDYYGYDGKIKHSASYLFDNLYLVDESQIYLYKGSDDSDWKTNLDYCFVKPVMQEMFSVKSKKNLTGVVIHTKDDTLSNCTIGFTPESEYEFEIDGSILYRMRERDICIKFE